MSTQSLAGNSWEKALFTFDERIIREEARRQNVTMPTENKLFWFTVAGGILRSKRATEFDKSCALHIINEVKSELLRRAYTAID